MKKTFIKNIRREITKSISRFMAILAIVALAATLYLGNQYIPQFIDFKYISIPSLILLAIFIFSILFTIIIALLSVNKYIKINRDRLYL